MSVMPNTRFTILLAGPVVPTTRLRSQLEGTRVIAADGGIAHAAALGLTPELWLGDFDSAAPDAGDAFPDLPRQTYPPAKAMTDGALAIDAARQLGATSIELVGAFGGRTDHSFALMTAACALAAEGFTVRLSNGREEAVPLAPEPTRFDYAPGILFSVLAFTDLRGLTLTGAQWPLSGASVAFGDSLPISNAVAGDLSASLTSGRALLIAQLAP